MLDNTAQNPDSGSISSVKVNRKTVSFTLWGGWSLLGQQTLNSSNTWFFRERGKRGKKNLPGLKMSAEDPRICQKERTLFQNVLPQY